jgi:hypothetical protein
MGHSSTRAARVYLHAREERDRQLASTLDKMARRELRRSSDARRDGRSGTQRARGRPEGSQRDLAIMAGRWPELGIQHVERVTRIELALSAWESEQNSSSCGLTCQPMYRW